MNGNERTRWTTRALVRTLLLSGSALCCSLDAKAEEPVAQTQPTWAERYETARKHLVTGELRIAQEEFAALALEAPNENEKRLALEMSRIATTWAESTPSVRPQRTRDEISLLYATSFLYGAGTGTWFLLHTQPDTALTATLPFIGITAAPVVTLALVDGYSPLPHGMPHGIAVGMYVGLGEAVLLTSYQRARARRVYEDSPTSNRWSVEEVSSVLWAGATLGGIAGGAISASLPTTPGRVSYVGSLALWGGLLGGFASGALLPETSSRTEHAMLGAGLGYNLGLVGGLVSASSVLPSVTRVRLVDLSALAGGLAVGGSYLALASDPDSRAAMALTGIGSAAGLAVGWFATRGMPKDRSASSGGLSAAQISVQPTITPVNGGGLVGLAGTMF